MERRKRERKGGREETATVDPAASTAGPAIANDGPDDTIGRSEVDAREFTGGDLDREEIARRAYERYQQRGATHGDDQSDWFEAEREVREKGTR